MNSEKLHTLLGSGLLFNSVTEEEKGFCGSELVTYLYTWAYPSSHLVQAVFTIFDVNKGETFVDFYLKSKSLKTRRNIIRLTVTANNSISSYAFKASLPFKFDKAGRYYVIASLPEFKSEIEIPFDVIYRRWPSFTKKEIDYINSKNDMARSIQLNIFCKTCNHSYTFEEKLNKLEPLTKGALKFPEAGHFKCEGCKNTLELKDIQGRLRYSLKRLVQKQMSKI